MDRGAWRATVHGIAKSSTEPKHRTHTHIMIVVIIPAALRNILPIIQAMIL